VKADRIQGEHPGESLGNVLETEEYPFFQIKTSSRKTPRIQKTAGLIPARSPRGYLANVLNYKGSFSDLSRIFFHEFTKKIVPENFRENPFALREENALLGLKRPPFWPPPGPVLPKRALLPCRFFPFEAIAVVTFARTCREKPRAAWAPSGWAAGFPF
jgi:hypothetical protein